MNFFLRNFVQAAGTLIFLFLQSWKLSLVAFVSVPAIVVISRVYGAYIRALSKATQEKLAQANVIAEEALSTMTTVRSFACEEEEGGPGFFFGGAWGVMWDGLGLTTSNAPCLTTTTRATLTTKQQPQ